MPLADEVADKVRGLPNNAWIRLKWYWTPEGLAAFDPEIVRRGVDAIDWREVAMAGDWIRKYDSYRAEKIEDESTEDDGEPADPDVIPHANIYTEDYR
jgi:hypothetical protein